MKAKIWVWTQILYDVICGIQERHTQRNREQTDGCEWLGVGELGDISQKIEIFSYTINEFGDLMQSMVIIANNTVSHM